MASRYYDNSDGAQRFQPGTTARADEVDAKLDQVAAGFEQAGGDIDRSLKLPASETSQEINATPLQRRRRVVGFDADGNLTLLTGFNWRDDWATATEYFVNDVFRDPATKNIYVTVTRHTSAAALSTDITAGRVELAINVEDVEQLKAETQQIKDDAVSETTTIKNAAQAAATTATTKAGESSTSASQSATARNKAQQWAEENENTAVESGQFSAKHHAIKSAASASASSASAGQSATARDKSRAWAETPENTEVEAGQYSAKHHALRSSASASAASASAGTAATKAEQTGQDALNTAADVVQTGQDRVATGQDRVATGQDRQAAEGAAQTAAEKAQQTAADRQQTGEDRAAAAQSAQAAGQSESNAAATLADFLKRYLGPFETPPTTDNEGGPLLVGALYYSTVTGDAGMRQWTGAAWENAYATIDGVSWGDISGKPALYTQTEIDTMIGDIGSILDAINGEAA